LTTLAIATIPAILSGAFAYYRNRIGILKYKADSMAESTAKHFLSHKGYTDRKFETIKKYLGGWDNDEDELRRILVRAGAVRTRRDHVRSLRKRHSSTTVCPRCGSSLVERTAKKGPNAGSKFLGCESYPRCRFSKDV